jgi:DNA replication ATP-dependent helicase Dna2
MHLLPTLDERLIQRLAELETHPPDPSDVVEYARWKDEVKALQRQIPKPLNEAQLAAMTTTLGAFIFEDLHQRRPFDLVVFDEASQVSLSHALILAPLGKKVLFAGDDQQLAPIVQSDRYAAQKWLGRSMFTVRENCPTCFLDEQSRMEESICDVVSNVFYDGKLLVAEGCETDPVWRSDHFVRDVPPMGKKNVYLHTCHEEGAFHPSYSGPVRFESAEFISELVQRLMYTMRADDVVILTPFRAQRTVIKAKLRRHGIRDVRVSTVHRAQGAESHTVIFDPVMAGGKFFDERMGGRRLINVALSRAKARLIIVASPGDLNYPCLAQVSTILSNRGGPSRDALPLEDIVFKTDFPNAFIGTVVQFKDWAGEISKSSESDQFCLVDFHTGKTLKLKTDVIRRICQQQSAAV